MRKYEMILFITAVIKTQCVFIIISFTSVWVYKIHANKLLKLEIIMSNSEISGINDVTEQTCVNDTYRAKVVKAAQDVKSLTVKAMEISSHLTAAELRLDIVTREEFDYRQKQDTEKTKAAEVVSNESK